ncbi:VanZ family protein [Streptomyces sp. NPDC048507]|uniref:VanZ family protein n=1 Tax=Streptomyces sp. NPDC048507 TaxID=3365560 RepID=UPI0037142A8B
MDERKTSAPAVTRRPAWLSGLRKELGGLRKDPTAPRAQRRSAPPSPGTAARRPDPAPPRPPVPPHTPLPASPAASPSRPVWWRRRTAPAPAAEPVRPARPAHPVVRALAMLAAFAGTVLFSIALARVTLEPSAASAALVHSNVHPGASINAYLDGASVKDAVKQLGGNLLLGVPFGILLPVLVPQTRGLLRVALTTAVVMTLVELVQGALVTGRAFDVDDVILNTSGALLGYLFLGRRASRAVHPRRHHWWQRRPRPAPALPSAAAGEPAP